ncbi:PTPA-CTERM sorting domain-containing protein [filamentous cyanobacterium LEGE 11480]|uniref:PTPA-CTERM sorting domain-containing protein n=1 Tax=Romeriopsis navalis LEGE 11480 TaxID=2777977 RepID=A0A928Z514_9CYAN|nr:PTPA-CTERM sorting domain-containing protein [Romeriopsis navalis]MBE9030770.1 PTPA-CTERM sorting domain-containing protein [Romeriopsis navalis LEGE 11480]
MQKMISLQVSLVAVAAVTAAVGFGKPASAMSLACSAISPDVTSNVTGTSGCELGSANNDNPIPGQVNNDMFFGFDDWIFAGKDEGGGALEDQIGVGYVPGTSTAGSYDISAVVQSNWSDVLLVFKGGNNSNPQRVVDGRTISSFVGYRIDPTAGFTGDWTSPFSNTNNPNLKAVSHLSLYYREGTPAIPTPAMLPGLIGMGVAALRKRKSLATAEQEA